MNGELEGDSLEGGATWNAYQMTFTAKRAE